MADNVVLNVGTGGDTLAADEITGVKHQRVKIQFGTDGVATDVSSSDPLPADVSDRALRDCGKIDIAGIEAPLAAGSNLIGKVDGNGVVSTANSTTTPLGIGGTFTGTYEEIKDYASIVVAVFADQNSATDGLKFQWSTNASNLDLEEVVDVLANTGRAYTLTPRARYFRVSYTNGGTAQGAFRLQTVYHSNDTGAINRPLDKVINDTFFAHLTRTIVSAKRTDGNYGNIRSTNGDNLKVSISEFDNAPLPVGTNNIGKVESKVDLSPNAPTFATVGVASAQALAANANRKGLVLINTSVNRISLGFGSAAVLDSGITLYPQGVFVMDEYLYDQGAVNAIASAGSSNLAIQEYQ